MVDEVENEEIIKTVAL